MPPHDPRTRGSYRLLDMTPQFLPFAVAQIMLAGEPALGMRLAFENLAVEFSSEPISFAPKRGNHACGAAPRKACDRILEAA